MLMQAQRKKRNFPKHPKLTKIAAQRGYDDLPTMLRHYADRFETSTAIAEELGIWDSTFQTAYFYCFGHGFNAQEGSGSLWAKPTPKYTKEDTHPCLDCKARSRQPLCATSPCFSCRKPQAWYDAGLSYRQYEHKAQAEERKIEHEERHCPPALEAVMDAFENNVMEQWEL